MCRVWKLAEVGGGCVSVLSPWQGKNAVTYAPWAFREGEQLFENYGQANHQVCGMRTGR